ncbi:aminoglycoside 3'-phosphotransferase [Microbacterium thalassium]|uniref:Kanamycin kinase n=1 Tax=Microbacterium thalassium TaxID=362649 RepID=A0A7X0FSI4_9MICO|nr:aminoglycoside 3'-phosphotransferase [Microbacterium thalassium]MBB6392744.1 kanamycin kinase [Microbacterium thalassium]GLK23024.1 putative phosphotransferase [Microbacterium thalassium]
MSIPAPDLAVPARVRRLAGDAELVPAWRNDYGGLTFQAADAAGIRFIKYGPHDPETSMADEAERLRWAARFTPVPRVLEAGSDATHEWLVTVGLQGESAVSPRWIADPATAVRAIGAGLRALHDSLPVGECPFQWGVEQRIADAAARGIQVPDDVRSPPSVDRLVVCHGDACAPNTLISDAGAWTAHVDLGALGVGDRWADIAVAALSTGWNYGPGWEEALVAAYGVPFDAVRMRYYQRLWEAT